MSIKDQIYNELKEQIKNIKQEIEDNNIILNSLLDELVKISEE